MSNKRYYEVDVPTTLTVFVEGEGLTPEEAMEEAARYAERMSFSESESDGYSSVAFAGRSDGLAITKADLDVSGPLRATDTTDDRLDS